MADERLRASHEDRDRVVDVLRVAAGDGRLTANEHRDGSWVVPERIELRVTGGNVTLDFTEAVIALPSLQIDAIVAGGNLTLVTRPGIVVNTDDVALAGGRLVVRESPEPSVLVLLNVNVSGKFVGGNIRVRPPRPPRRPPWQRPRKELG
jgi:hypothetical protein